MERYIANQLMQYLEDNKHPWHMPGHKRKSLMAKEGTKIQEVLSSAMPFDVTEVPGTDDLYYPEEGIKKSLEQLKDIYKSAYSTYIVNGATGGILAAIRAVAKAGDKGIVARNCHKSVYNACSVFGIEPVYIAPVSAPENENLPRIEGAITPGEVEGALEKNSDAKFIILSSPNYDGVLSDIEGISEVAHKFGVALIVDEAHGAHLPFMKWEKEARSAVYAGADIVVQSLHKTLAAFTQTAMIHVMNENYVELVKDMVATFMTSSPSYLMLYSMEEAICRAYEKDTKEYLSLLAWFREQVNQMSMLHVVTEEQTKMLGADAYDETRIIIYSKNHISGKALVRRLEEIGGIVCEMAGLDYALLISTMEDEREDFIQLVEVLKVLDQELAMGVDIESDGEEQYEKQDLLALVGTVAKDNVYVYPPGSYILTKGEDITEEAIARLLEYVESKNYIRGKLL